MIHTAMLGVITLCVVFTILGRSNRSMELKGNLSSVMEETVENLFLDEASKNLCEDEILNQFIDDLLLCMDSNSDVEIDIFAFDRIRGLLSARVTAIYEHPNGKEGRLSSERTVITELLPGKEEKRMGTICFWMEEECYKMYQIAYQDTIVEPYLSEQIKGRFLGWKDEEGNLINFPQEVRGDANYYAVLQE